MIVLLLTGLAAVAVLMVLVWLLSVALADVSIIDPAWGFGFVVIAVTYALADGDMSGRDWLVLAMVTIWGLRLGIYLTHRKWGEPEDHRYAAMREKRPGSFAYRSLITVFMLQALLLWVVAWPLAASIGANSPTDIGIIEMVALFIFLVGLVFETVADYELARFKANPDSSGKLLTTGLRRYTRHPNYFGDFLVWWGIGIIGVTSAGGWWSILGPILISVLLMKVSGVGMLKKSMSSKPGFEEYAARTNTFFPWFPSTPG